MGKIYKFRKKRSLTQNIIITVVLAFIFGLTLLVFLPNGFNKITTKIFENPPTSPLNIAGDVKGYARVIDGDSLKINGVSIRLHGIDAPEINQPCWRGDQHYQCGKIAKSYLAYLVSNKPVICQTYNQDKYGRTIAKCYNHNGQDIQALMALNGHAIAYLYYSSEYETQQNEAKKTKRGIWAGRFTEPYLFRKRSK